MISSKPSEALLDHDHLIDVNGNIYVVVGNMHPPGRAIAYLKYVPSTSRTIWCKGATCYERVVRKYGVRNVIGSISTLQEYSYDPVFGVKVPKVSLKNVRRHLNPRERLQEIIRRPKDRLEALVIEVVLDIEQSVGVPINRMGVTGSILVDIHNPEFSDIDLTIYGCRECVEFVEGLGNLRNVGKTPTNILLKHVESLSRIYGLPKDFILRIHPPYRRLWLRDGKEVNVIFVDNHVYRYGDVTFKPIATIELTAELEGNVCTSLFYPATSRIIEVKGIKYLSNYIEYRELRSLLKYLVSFEGIFSYIMYKGGLVRVRGVLELIKPLDEYAVIVGGYEEPGFILPVS